MTHHSLNAELGLLLAPLSLTTDERLAVSVAILVMMLLGAYNIRSWRVQQARAARLEEIDETPIGDVETGLTVVSGVAKPAGETMERETQDGECLAVRRRTVRHEVTETRNRERGEQNDQEMETKRSTSNSSVPFLVEDETGSILVSADSTPKLRLRETDSVTEHPTLEEQGEKPLGRVGGGKEYLRYTSKTQKTYRELLPGDDVTVFGTAVNAADHESKEGDEAETDMVLTNNDETGDFSVTHFDKEHLIERNSSHLLLIGGGLFVVGGATALGYVWLVL